ncbi:hypothetical protein M231_03068 [Tremella mesenterica]|uniref:Uncharacterized protein n=1 Tax=Tremella mesenterica TaxID=5217 RepID=A0A4Q1BPA6_TREME|nr:hypothetical protein M231_03068 [Tremella mesenterica]
MSNPIEIPLPLSPPLSPYLSLENLPSPPSPLDSGQPQQESISSPLVPPVQFDPSSTADALTPDDSKSPEPDVHEPSNPIKDHESELPQAKTFLPPRRPKEWDSVVHQTPRGISITDLAKEGKRSVSNSMMRIGGRTISGTLQYALLPDVPQTRQEFSTSVGDHTTDPTSVAGEDRVFAGTEKELRKKEEEDKETGSVREVESDDGMAEEEHLENVEAKAMRELENAEILREMEEEVNHFAAITAEGKNVNVEDSLNMEDKENDSNDQEQGDNTSDKREPVVEVNDLTNQDQDEIWMSYIRQQLNTLFPDFFPSSESENSDDIQPNSNPYYPRFPSLSMRQYQPINSDQYDMPTPPLTASRRMIPEDGDMADTSFSSADTSISNFPHPLHGDEITINSNEMGLRVRVPNVRNEIADMKDEISRLRTVVGGIAEELKIGQNVTRSGDTLSSEVGPEGVIWTDKMDVKSKEEISVEGTEISGKQIPSALLEVS